MFHDREFFRRNLRVMCGIGRQNYPSPLLNRLFEELPHDPFSDYDEQMLVKMPLGYSNSEIHYYDRLPKDAVIGELRFNRELTEAESTVLREFMQWISQTSITPQLSITPVQDEKAPVKMKDQVDGVTYPVTETHRKRVLDVHTKIPLTKEMILRISEHPLVKGQEMSQGQFHQHLRDLGLSH